MIELGFYKAKFNLQLGPMYILKNVEIEVVAIYVHKNINQSYVLIRVNRDNEFRKEIKGFLKQFEKAVDLTPKKRIR